MDVCIVDSVDSKDSSEDRHAQSTKLAPILPRPGVVVCAARKRPVLFITLALASPNVPMPKHLGG